MAPEYGSTCGIFPIDEETIRYLELTGRPAAADRAGRGLRKAAGHVARTGSRKADYTDVLELDLADVEPSIGGPEAPAGSRRTLKNAAERSLQLEPPKVDGPPASCAKKPGATAGQR